MKIITIGRDLSNDIIIEDERVSRHHLQLVERDGTYQAVDLDSTNGTFVNGRRIQGAVSLGQHDTIRIGNTDLLWQAYFEKDDVRNSVDLPSKSLSGESALPFYPERPARRPRGRKSRVWPILITVVVILAIAVGVNTWFNYQSGKSLDERASALEKRKSGQQPLPSEEVNSQEEFQRLYEEAILSQRDSAMAKAKDAKEAQERAEIAKRRADSLRKRAEEKAKIDVASANTKASSAETEKIRALNDKAAAEKAKREADNLTKKADSLRDVAVAAASDAQTRLDLTKEFYKACAGFKKSHYEAVCKRQNWPVGKGEDAQSIVETKFEQADASEKRNIINVIGKLKKETPAEEASAPADTSETKSPENN